MYYIRMIHEHEDGTRHAECEGDWCDRYIDVTVFPVPAVEGMRFEIENDGEENEGKIIVLSQPEPENG